MQRKFTRQSGRGKFRGNENAQINLGANYKDKPAHPPTPRLRRTGRWRA
ncbi:MAG TPA: hypothetical protein HPP66_01975 [Planctomycetes bacterium]|nr:hypothetical protein [Planctomycetota bacterium]